jgi:hypothetical protein
MNLGVEVRWYDKGIWLVEWEPGCHHLELGRIGIYFYKEIIDV